MTFKGQYNEPNLYTFYNTFKRPWYVKRVSYDWLDRTTKMYVAG